MTDQAGEAVGYVFPYLSPLAARANVESHSGATDKVGKTLGGLTGGGKKSGEEGEDEEDGGGQDQLRLRLELNLDVEIQLKAKIHGDLTLGLLN